MEAVLLIGLPGAGKSSFFKERFFNTHVRIGMDLLKTRHREQRFISTCLESGQRFVIDNTNPTRTERAGYIKQANGCGYQVIGYYLQSVIEDCLRRNALRPPSERVPDVAILATAKKLELPQYGEGFDQLFYIRLEQGKFVSEEWQSEV